VSEFDPPTCHYCGQTEDVTGGQMPFGPAGASVCFPCVTSDPERDAAATEVFRELEAEACAASPIGAVVLSNDAPPRPAYPEDLQW
jgi:hypothetical protein